MTLDERMRAQAEKLGPDKELMKKTVSRMEAASERGAAHRPANTAAHRLLTALMAIALVFAIASYAAIAYKNGLLPGIEEAFSKIFGTSEEQTVLLDELAIPEESVCTRGGICVAATAQLLDQKVVVVQLRVSRENGEPLLPADTPGFESVYFASMSGDFKNQLDFFGATFDITNKGQFPTYTPGDTEAYGYLTFEKITDADITDWEWYMGDLCAIYSGGCEYLASPEIDEHGEEIAPKDVFWELDIPVLSSREGKTLAEGAEFAANGHTFRIDGIHVSPFAVLAIYTVTDTTISENAVYGDIDVGNGTQIYGMIDNNTRSFWEGIELALRLKDGTVIDMSTFTMGQPAQEIINPIGYIEEDYKRDLYIAHRGDVLPQIIPYEEMDCVILGGVEYPVNE